MTDDELMSRDEVAAHLGISPESVRSWARRQKPQVPVHFGYSRADVEAAIARRTGQGRRTDLGKTMEEPTATNPDTYNVAILGYPQRQFVIGQRVRVLANGLPTDPGYEAIYRQGDKGTVEKLGNGGFDVVISFADGGACRYTALDLGPA